MYLQLNFSLFAYAYIEGNFHSLKTEMRYLRESWKYVSDWLNSKPTRINLYGIDEFAPIWKLHPSWSVHKIPSAFTAILRYSADTQPGTFWGANLDGRSKLGVGADECTCFMIRAQLRYQLCHFPNTNYQMCDFHHTFGNYADYSD